MGKQRTMFQVAEIAAATERVIAEIRIELFRARVQFPQSNLSVAALTEEVGEVAKAMLGEPHAAVINEAVQAAVMAIRVAVEGDASFDAHRVAQGLALIAPPFEQSEREWNARAANGAF